MLKKIWVCLIMSGCIYSSYANAADLLRVYCDALKSDPLYQEAIAQQFVDVAGVPITLAALLPQLSATATPNMSQVTTSGSGSLLAPHRTKGYDANLTLTQTVFDLAKYSRFNQARMVEKQAYATLNAATQDLMMRASRAYFKILEDEDNIRSSRSAKEAFAKQLDEVREQYNVGLKTVTDVYTAKASYEGAVAQAVADEARLATDREFLRGITGYLYCGLDKLSDDFPLITPCPKNINAWVCSTIKHNWLIKAAQYARCAAMENVRVQRAGHFPTLNLQATQDNVVTTTWGDDSILTTNGVAQTHTTQVSAILGIPIYQGGLVLAQTRQAKFQYLVTSERLEKQIRDSVTLARNSYLNVVAGIIQIQADRQRIVSARSSLAGMEAAYLVGTETLVNVLNQRRDLYVAERIYAADRYAYVINLLQLKQAAGTLSCEDIAAINSWLYTGKSESIGFNFGIFSKFTDKAGDNLPTVLPRSDINPDIPYDPINQILSPNDPLRVPPTTDIDVNVTPSTTNITPSTTNITPPTSTTPTTPTPTPGPRQIPDANTNITPTPNTPRPEANTTNLNLSGKTNKNHSSDKTAKLSSAKKAPAKPHASKKLEANNKKQKDPQSNTQGVEPLFTRQNPLKTADNLIV